MKRAYLPLLFIPLFACAPTTQERVSDRVSEVEIKLTRLQQKQTDLEKDIERTHERIDRLTELISDLRIEIERVKLRIEGIQSVSSQLPQPTELPKPEEKEEVVAKPKSPDAESAYRKAIELYSIKKLYEARDAFLEFIKRFPENKYTDNAFFWIGKIYHELGDSRRAESVYKSLVGKCERGELPDCNKLPDTYFQLMKLYVERGDRDRANEYYSILIDRFPTSDAAVRAREQKLLLGE
ncbi:MAG TPA: tetratricopeptide repeat protein [Aquifex aeolicus]|nr:tetratricopeptide repeat protein [Aquifex aeolicus]